MKHVNLQQTSSPPDPRVHKTLFKHYLQIKALTLPSVESFQTLRLLITSWWMCHVNHIQSHLKEPYQLCGADAPPFKQTNKWQWQPCPLSLGPRPLPVLNLHLFLEPSPGETVQRFNSKSILIHDTNIWTKKRRKTFLYSFIKEQKKKQKKRKLFVSALSRRHNGV